MAQLTGSEARLLRYVSEKANKFVTDAGWVWAEYLWMEGSELASVAGHSDFHRLDLELDHLRSLELIAEGFNPQSTRANVTPSAMALHWYVRCQGSQLDPVQYFNLRQAAQPTQPNNAMDSDTAHSALRAPHGARHRGR